MSCTDAKSARDVPSIDPYHPAPETIPPVQETPLLFRLVRVGCSWLLIQGMQDPQRSDSHVREGFDNGIGLDFTNPDGIVDQLFALLHKTATMRDEIYSFEREYGSAGLAILFSSIGKES